MNEKQRLESTKLRTDLSADRKSSQDKPLSEKTTEDFAIYFQTTYQPPDICKARKRGREQVKILYDFEIPDDMKNIGEGKKFLIRTYGCQMNEHDSETMAGMLMEMGYEATTKEEEADIIILNTCAIRENAENKVFGEIGHLKQFKVEKPDMILGVSGCMPQTENSRQSHFGRSTNTSISFSVHTIFTACQNSEGSDYQQSEVVWKCGRKKAISSKTSKGTHRQNQSLGEHHVRLRQVLYVLYRADD